MMKILTAILSIGLLYGFARLIKALFRELALFAIEAWRDVEN